MLEKRLSILKCDLLANRSLFVVLGLIHWLTTQAFGLRGQWLLPRTPNSDLLANKSYLRIDYFLNIIKTTCARNVPLLKIPHDADVTSHRPPDFAWKSTQFPKMTTDMENMVSAYSEKKSFSFEMTSSHVLNLYHLCEHFLGLFCTVSEGLIPEKYI